LPTNPTTHPIKTCKCHTINSSTNQITFGIQTRKEFKQTYNLELVFWLNGVHKYVYNVIPKSKEGLTMNYVTNPKNEVILRFYIFKMRDIEVTTLKNTSQGHAWQCKKRLDDKFSVQRIPRFL
jgi:hypothetical protein